MALRSRKSTTGIGACTYFCQDTGEALDGLLEGLQELGQTPGGEQLPGVSPIIKATPAAWVPQVSLKIVCWPSGPGQSRPGRKHSSVCPTLVTAPSPIPRLPSLHLVSVLIGEGGRGMATHPQNAPSLSVATLSCSLPYPNGQMLFEN